MSIHERSGVKSGLACMSIALAALLAACGGGGGGGDPVPVPPDNALPLMVDGFGRQVPEADFGRGDSSAAGAEGIAFDFGPIANAPVTLVDNGGSTRTTTTDASGYYRLDIKNLQLPFIVKVKRANGTEWFSTGSNSAITRAFVPININGLTDKTLGYVAEALDVGGGAASAVTPSVMAPNFRLLDPAKAKLRGGLAVPLADVGLDPATYDPVTTAVRASISDKNALLLRRLMIDKTAKGRTSVAWTSAGAGGRLQDGPAAIATFNLPSGLAFDTAGNLFVADSGNSVIRRITPAGVVSTFAGSGAIGLADGPAAVAAFNHPSAVAVDFAGNVYVVDKDNQVIRKITPAGGVTTLAGSGTRGYVDAAGALAKFSEPTALAVDASGNVYVTDNGNRAIRKITPAGVVTTVAGTGECCMTTGFVNPLGIAVDAAGNLYVAQSKDARNAVVKITPAGEHIVLYAEESAYTFFAYGITVDSVGNVYLTDPSGDRVQKITSPGTIATLTAGISSPAGIAVDASGNVLVADYGNNAIRRLTAAGELSTFAGKSTGFADGMGTTALFNAPTAVVLDAAGNTLVADTNNHAIRRISANGVVTTLAGSGAAGFADGNGNAATFNAPGGLAVDGSGNIYVADSQNNAIRKISPAGVVSTLGGSGAAGFANGTGRSATFNGPSHVAVDRNGNVYVSDAGNIAVRKITPGGVVSTVVGLGRGPGSDAELWAQEGLWDGVASIVVDQRGTVYFSARCAYFPPLNRIKSCIFTVSLEGVVGRHEEITTFNFYSHAGLAVDNDSNLYYILATSFPTIKNRVFKLTPGGTETEVAFLPRLAQANGIAFDATGNLVIADTGNSAIRIVLP